MKQAFTMIELIFVIIIVGILSSIAISKIHNTNKLIEVAQNIINDIRYTQYLGLNYNKDNQEYYKIVLASNKRYKITDKHRNDLHLKLDDYAPDYLNSGKYMCDFNNEKCAERTNFNMNYYFTPTKPTKDRTYTPTNDIYFNDFGEPLNYNKIPSGFTIKIQNNNEAVCIVVEELTGFTWLDRKCDSLKTPIP